MHCYFSQFAVVEHRVTVAARSLFEAVCKAWPKFGGNHAPRVDDFRGV